VTQRLAPALEAVPAVEIETLSASSAAGQAALVIDLRSPAEFALDHLPGAINLPLLDDAERALVGTLYRTASPETAFGEGLRAVRARIGELVAEVGRLAGWTPPSDDVDGLFAALADRGLGDLERAVAARPLGALPGAAVVLHCWRGGLRSRSVVAFLRALGLERAVALEGGYRAWRARVLRELEGWRAPPTFVLRGLTGVGKTLVLRALERLRPDWTVDLEGLAGHRSSILGMVGLEPVSQKRFDSRLCARLARGFAGPAVFEGESRKVGDVTLPARVWTALQAGTNALLEAPLERRVEVLIDDYLAHAGSRAALRDQLPFIESRLGASSHGALVALLDQGRERELVRILLERYYDPLYRHSERGRAYAARFDASDPERAAQEIADWIDQTLRHSSARPSRACAPSS
jgi:tRNA 2-selenouridine synthase